MLAEYLRFVSSAGKPRLVRGDVSFGGESAVGDCEAADVRYLFKARRTKGVRGVFPSLLAEPGAWRGSSDGWQCARRGVVTIYTAASGRARDAYRAISAFLAKVSSASQLPPEGRRQLIVAYALRRYGLVRRLFPPLIGRQATLPLR